MSLRLKLAISVSLVGEFVSDSCDSSMPSLLSGEAGPVDVGTVGNVDIPSPMLSTVCECRGWTLCDAVKWFGPYMVVHNAWPRHPSNHNISFSTRGSDFDKK